MNCKEFDKALDPIWANALAARDFAQLVLEDIKSLRAQLVKQEIAELKAKAKEEVAK